MINSNPTAGQILNGSRTTTGTIITIPAGCLASVNIQVSGSVSTLATGTPSVTVSGGGVGVEPASGSTLCRLSMSGLALTTVADSAYQDVLVRTGDADATLQFNTGGATSASVTINGFYN
jgi:hypothetical protein